MGTPEREERIEEIFKTVMMEKFPKLKWNIKPQIQELRER